MISATELSGSFYQYSIGRVASGNTAFCLSTLCLFVVSYLSLYLSQGANLKSATFDNSQMSCVNLRLASLKGACLRSCNLRYAIMAGTDMEVRGRGRGGRVRACVCDCVLLFGVCVCVFVSHFFFILHASILCVAYSYVFQKQ